jgi:iron complex outermembrane receptor protein
LNRARLAVCVVGHVVGAVGVPLTAVAGPQPPISDSPLTKIEFHLQSQLVGDALTAVGQQSGLNIAVSSTLTKDLKSSPLDGRYTATEALVRILADTGLRAEFLDRKTVVVVAVSQAANAAPQRQLADEKSPQVSVER